MQHSTQYLSLKVAQASKTGSRATGQITYRLLAAADRSELYIRIEGNEGGGYASKELVPFSKIIDCLQGLESQHFPARALSSVFTGRSANNHGFLIAICHAENILEAVSGVSFAHRICADLDKYRADTLALNGEPFAIVPPESKGNAKSKEKEAISGAESSSADDGVGKRKSGKKSDPVRQHPTHEQEQNHAHVA